MMIARHTEFLLAAVLAFAGRATCVTGCRAVFFAACLLFYPLPYYLVNPFVRYKHPIEPVMTLLIVYLFAEASKVQLRWPFQKSSN